MTITITVAGRIATATATTQVVAGNTYPVTLSLDSEWTGSLYLRVRFGGLYYDIPFASSATSVDVQFPVGYPEVGIGVFSEALEICTNEARVRLLRSILEAGEQVVEFDSDLYDQWAGEVTTLLTDDAFDAESTRPVQNAVLTAWKDTVPLDSALVHKTGNESIAGEKTFTSTLRGKGSVATMLLTSTLASTTDGWKTKLGFTDVRNGSDSEMARLIGETASTFNALREEIAKPDRSGFHVLNIRSYQDYLTIFTVPAYPVDGSGNPQAIPADALEASGQIAVDPRLVHTTGNDTVAGAKTFTSLLTASNVQVKDASTPTITMLKGSTEVANLASDEAQAGLTASSQFFGLRGLDATPFGQAPSYTADNSADGKIVTRSMLAQSPTVVHTTGNETVAGNKTFTHNIVSTTHIYQINAVIATETRWVRLYEISPHSNAGDVEFIVRSRTGASLPSRFQLHCGGAGTSTLTWRTETNPMSLQCVAARRSSDNHVEIWGRTTWTDWQIPYYYRHQIAVGDNQTADDAPAVGDTYNLIATL